MRDIEDYYIFAILRDPFDRSKSMYSYLHNKASQGMADRYKGVLSLQSFSEFPDWLEENSYKEDFFLMPQVHYLKDKMGNISDKIHLVMMEELDEKFKEISIRVKGVEASLGRINASKKSDNFQEIESGVKERIYDLYREDEVLVRKIRNFNG